MYQPWFEELLREAIIFPSEIPSEANNDDGAQLVLPTGRNSFFRQLDFMVATLVNEEFYTLYTLTSKLHDFSAGDGKSSQDPKEEVIQQYSDYKAAIFARYRTLCEILGILLIREAQSRNLNVMVKTSGRDIAMFHYVDQFFDRKRYRKLALHFTINDLSCAEESVDARMIREMREGHRAVVGSLEERQSNCEKKSATQNIIRVNAGGPYGSDILKGVQHDSDRVWDEIVLNGGGVGGDWYKATIHIQASREKDWTAFAVRPDGSLGKEFSFTVPPKKV